MDEQRRFFVTMTSDAFPDPEDAFAIWDNQCNDYYIKGDGTVPTFPTEAQAEVFLSRLEDKIAGRSKPSIRTQLAEAQQNREKEQVQRLIDVLDKSMEAYKTEWSKASDDYLIADAHFICAVKDAYKYLTETHRLTPEEVDWMLRMKNPLHAVAV